MDADERRRHEDCTDERMAELIALGSVNVDVQARVDGWPRPGGTVLGRDRLITGGGKAANVAFLTQRLGRRARLIARVGDDEFAYLALSPLRDAGVDLDGVQRVAGAPTAVSLILVGERGEKAIVLVSGANDEFHEKDCDDIAESLRRAPPKSVLVANVEVTPLAVRAALAGARDRRLVTVLDPAPPERVDSELIALADYVTPDASEAEHMTGMAVDGTDAAVQAGERLVARGTRHALVKLREGGCVLVDAERRVHVALEGVTEVVDTTGAGDAFAGALGVALLEECSTVEAARRAVAASTFSVGRYGSQASYPTREELERVLARTRVSDA